MVGPTGAHPGATGRLGPPSPELEHVIPQRAGSRVCLGGVSECVGGQGAGGKPHAAGSPLDPVCRFGAKARFTQCRGAVGVVGIHAEEIRSTASHVNGRFVTAQSVSGRLVLAELEQRLRQQPEPRADLEPELACGGNRRQRRVVPVDHTVPLAAEARMLRLEAGAESGQSETGAGGDRVVGHGRAILFSSPERGARVQDVGHQP
jgi:hypothetical protein